MVTDKSVSRKHAEIELDFQAESVEDSSTRAVLRVIDKSKFGTFVNGSKSASPKQDLKDGDEIRFGVNVACTYRVSYEPLVVFWDPDSLPAKIRAQVIENVALCGKSTQH